MMDGFWLYRSRAIGSMDKVVVVVLEVLVVLTFAFLVLGDDSIENHLFRSK